STPSCQRTSRRRWMITPVSPSISHRSASAGSSDWSSACRTSGTNSMNRLTSCEYFSPATSGLRSVRSELFAMTSVPPYCGSGASGSVPLSSLSAHAVSASSSIHGRIRRRNPRIAPAPVTVCRGESAPISGVSRVESSVVCSESAQNAANEARKTVARLRARGDHLVVREGLRTDTGGEIRNERYAEHGHLTRTCHDHFRYGAHADGVRAHALEHPDLRRRLVARPRYRGVHALRQALRLRR